MQHFAREKGMFIFVVTSLILLVLMLSITTKTITNVSAVQVESVGVYKDKTCFEKVEFIGWGTLNPGSVRNYPVYVKNEADRPLFLSKSTANWTPSEASRYITLGWNYALQQISSDGVLQIELTLSISHDIREISDFSFDILITGSDRLPYDVNGDGKVSAIDLVLVLTHFGESSAQFPEGDVNNDGTVGVADLILIIVNFGAGG